MKHLSITFNLRPFLMLPALLLVACGGGGGGGGLPTISIADTSATEGDSGATSLNFTVTLSAQANGNVDVVYSTSDGSATAGSDYVAVSNAPLTIPAGNTSVMIAITVQGDTDAESNETLTVTLSNPSANVALGAVVATGTILDDDGTISSLNDTGITTCSDETSNNLVCPQVTHPGQDAEYGRDAQAQAGTLTKVGGGRAGFDFTKLDADGKPLTNQTESYAVNPWSCVRDNHTGLVWEVKTIYGGLRDASYSYSWYNSTGINDGGAPGRENAGICFDGFNCDTEKYVAAVNTAGLCGQKDWRLPTVDELLSLVDSSIIYPGSAIDNSYFPNTRPSYFWTSSPVADNSALAWYVSSAGRVSYYGKGSTTSVRLVRSGQ